MVGRAEGRGSRAAEVRHLGEAHRRVRGEIQPADYVASPTSLRDECRVAAGEKRGSDEGIRVRTLRGVWGLEGG